ncbi:MAG: hypothetical protein JWM80_2514 [Cyanobacteria bacterium RYN_339]|nr:hypothetical protein [Cyanobacteria bacterium RYN_339]
MDANDKVTVRVRKKRKAESRPAPKGRNAIMGAGVVGILLLAMLTVYEVVGPEPAQAVVPWFNSK